MSRSYKYRELLIYENRKGSQFGTKYYSIVNPKKFDKNGKMLHTHSFSKKQIKKIADCFHKIKRGKFPGKYNLNTRNKAMRLGGYYIKMK